MNPEILEQIRKICAQSIAQNAKIDALTAFLQSFLKKTGLPLTYLDEQIEVLAQTLHQKRLERLEGVAPLESALLDYRSEQDVSFVCNNLLDSIRFLDND
jgi:hypothetical protein